jgi:hypothetical protein
MCSSLVPSQGSRKTKKTPAGRQAFRWEVRLRGKFTSAGRRYAMQPAIYQTGSSRYRRAHDPPKAIVPGSPRRNAARNGTSGGGRIASDHPWLSRCIAMLPCSMPNGVANKSYRNLRKRNDKTLMLQCSYSAPHDSLESGECSRWAVPECPGMPTCWEIPDDEPGKRFVKASFEMRTRRNQDPGRGGGGRGQNTGLDGGNGSARLLSRTGKGEVCSQPSNSAAAYCCGSGCAGDCGPDWS